MYGSSIPATLAKANDGGTITVATAFYVYGAGAEWNSIGARLYATPSVYVWVGYKFPNGGYMYAVRITEALSTTIYGLDIVFA